MPTWKRSMSGSRRSAFLIAIAAAALGSSACRKPTPAAPPTPEVLVAKVAQRDVPIYSEAVGTTEGFVNAQVRPRVQGYLLRQTYADGASVKAGDLLFEIDDRQYRAALDEARGNLARATGGSQEIRARRRTLHAARRERRRQQRRARRRDPGFPRSEGAGRRRRGRGRDRAAEPRLDASLRSDRRRRRHRAGSGRRPRHAGDALDDDLAARPDQGDVPDQRARVPAVRRSHSGAPAKRARRGRAGDRDDSRRRQAVSPSGTLPRRESAGRGRDRHDSDPGPVPESRRHPAARPLREGTGTDRGEARRAPRPAARAPRDARPVPGGRRRRRRQGRVPHRQTRRASRRPLDRRGGAHGRGTRHHGRTAEGPGRNGRETEGRADRHGATAASEG